MSRLHPLHSAAVLAGAAPWQQLLSISLQPAPTPLRPLPAAVAAELKGGGSEAPAQPAAPPYDGPLQPISSDDYFTKNAEFAAWLRDSRGKFFR